MAELKGGFTPKEAAVDIALGWLAAAYNGVTNDIAQYAGTPGLERDLKRSIAKLHNDLLAKSTLSGLPLDEEVEINRPVSPGALAVQPPSHRETSPAQR